MRTVAVLFSLASGEGAWAAREHRFRSAIGTVDTTVSEGIIIPKGSGVVTVPRTWQVFGASVVGGTGGSSLISKTYIMNDQANRRIEVELPHRFPLLGKY